MKSSCLEYSQDVFLSSSETNSLSSRSNLSYFAKKALEHYWLSSLEFFVLCSKSLDFHVLLLRHESTYKIYGNGHLSAIVHVILVWSFMSFYTSSLYSFNVKYKLNEDYGNSIKAFSKDMTVHLKL